MRFLKFLLVAVLSLSWSAGQSTAAPAFDCVDGQGKLKQLVCETPELMELDLEFERVFQAASAAGELESQGVSWWKARPRSFLQDRGSPCLTAAIGPVECLFNAYTHRMFHVLVGSSAAKGMVELAQKPMNISCPDFDSPIVAVIFDLPAPIIVLDWTHSRSIQRGVRTATGATFEASMGSALIVDGVGWSGKDRIKIDGNSARVVLAGQPEMACLVD
jgi:hypothetical protein